MSADPEVSCDANGVEDLSLEEARRKRALFLALAKEISYAQESVADQIDSADAAMATLILPGG